MKKRSTVFLCFFLLILLTVYSQSNVTNVYKSAIDDLLSNEAEEILLGNVNRLSDKYTLDYISLAKLDNKSYRILRNIIYAKHGHIFKSKELTDYFTQFPWYTPNQNVTDSMFSDVDKKNIEIIQQFENMDETKANVFLSDDKIGVWQKGYGMASGWGERFVIYDNNKIEFLFSQMKQLKIVNGYSGSYSIKGNVLIFLVKEIDFNEYSPEYSYSAGWGYEWKQQRRNKIIFSEPVILKFPISTIMNENSLRVKNVLSIKIGGYEFFMMEKDVNKRNE